VEFVGEIAEHEKESFLGQASALLFPVDWPEPFGLVMIEAVACGTPVIALNRGSVSEVIQDGVSGFVVDTTWLIPKLVGEVKFTEWTSEGEMRHPVFLGLRSDKVAADATDS
jgi:glycosyltransferase involved in cell wall biosynthesis